MSTAILCAGYAALTAAVYYIYTRIVKKNEELETRTDSPVQFIKDMGRVALVIAGKPVSDAVASVRNATQFRKDKSSPQFESRIAFVNEGLNALIGTLNKGGHTALVKRIEKRRPAIVRDIYCDVFYGDDDANSIAKFDAALTAAIQKHCDRSMTKMLESLLCGVAVLYSVVLLHLIAPLLIAAAFTVYILDKYFATPAARFFEQLLLVMGSVTVFAVCSVLAIAFLVTLPFVIAYRLATGAAMWVVNSTVKVSQYCYNKVCAACESTRNYTVQVWNKLTKKVDANTAEKSVDVPTVSSIKFGVPEGVTILPAM